MDSLKELFKHETKRSALFRFLAVLLIFVGYFVFIAYKYGLEYGFMVAILTWSFFVLCTPIADAGFLIDFPLRLVTRIRMFFSEVALWVVAILLNVYVFFVHPEIYEKTKVLELFKHILEQPFPFWGIIFVSMAGTFVSVSFGDELMDKVRYRDRKLYIQHRNKHKMIIMAALFIVAFIFYDFLLKKMGLEI